MYTKQTNIGIIGSGMVGQVLANAFLSEGNPVMLGTRNTTKEEVVKWHKENPGAAIGNPLFFVAEMISEANVSLLHHLNFYIALLYCKADLKLLHNSTGAILVGM